MGIYHQTGRQDIHITVLHPDDQEPSMAASKHAYDHLFKLLLIGDSGVGKTCIVFRFCENAFNTSFISTIGIDFKLKTIDLRGKRIKLQIWDTAGQERFRAITASFYRGAMGILLVYDITNSRSFENIANWLRKIDEYATPGVERMIVGNKIDIEDKRVVSKEKGEDIAKKHNVRFLETSAKTNINVEAAFIQIAEVILDKTEVEAEGRRIAEVNLEQSRNRSGGCGACSK